jgi:hypothetical protein
MTGGEKEERPGGLYEAWPSIHSGLQFIFSGRIIFTDGHLKSQPPEAYLLSFIRDDGSLGLFFPGVSEATPFLCH